MLHVFVSFSAVSLFINCNELPLSYQAQVTLQLTVNHSNLLLTFLASLPLLKGLKKFFHWGLNPFSFAQHALHSTLLGEEEY
jgi:hypothetical protein